MLLSAPADQPQELDPGDLIVDQLERPKPRRSACVITLLLKIALIDTR